MTEQSTSGGRALHVGTRVEVRSTFTGGWTDGFEVASVEESGYRLRRLSDGELLPVTIDAADVRRERRRQTWWM